MAIYCTDCDSYDIVEGDAVDNLDGSITITYTCLNCGDIWEIPAIENWS